MSKIAEERAMEVYPIQMEYCPERDLNEDARAFFQEGYEAAEKDIIAIIESRLSEIIGDAQPKPILRAELEELIKQIKNGKD